MSFLDGQNYEGIRLSKTKPAKDEKCIICGKPPATIGVEYCTKCGRYYAISIGAKEEPAQVKVKQPKAPRKPKTITGLPHNARRRLTLDEVKEIREYVAGGGKQKDMAMKFEVSAPHISNICAGKVR